MKKLFLLVFSVVYLYSYDVSDRWFGMWSADTGEVESSFDFYGCFFKVDTKNISKITFSNDCVFGENLVCTIEKDPAQRCVKRSHFKRLIVDSYNQHGYWCVYNVSSYDTLNIRQNPGVRYLKIYELSYRAKNIKVIDIKNIRRSTWYKIRYRGVTGWANAKYLRYRIVKGFD